MKSKILLSILAVFFTFSYAIADPNFPETSIKEHTDSGKSAVHKEDADKHKQVVEEYKKFLTAVPPAVRDEIREYRKSVTRINREKSTLYKKLSQEAQDFLSKERQYKMRLPLKDTRVEAAAAEQM
jgi:hypothetical protein